MVEIHRERGHATVEPTETPIMLGPIRRTVWDRGGVRLVVSTPPPPVNVPAVTGIFFASVVAVLACILLSDVSVIQPLILIAGVPLSGLAVVLVEAAYPPRLEVDSRFVTTSRGNHCIGLWGRGQMTNVRVNDEPTRGLSRTRWGRQRWPMVVWGEGAAYAPAGVLGWACPGLSREDAQLVVDAIEEFCREYPEDDTYDFRGPKLGPMP